MPIISVTFHATEHAHFPALSFGPLYAIFHRPSNCCPLPPTPYPTYLLSSRFHLFYPIVLLPLSSLHSRPRSSSTFSLFIPTITTLAFSTYPIDFAVLNVSLFLSYTVLSLSFYQLVPPLHATTPLHRYLSRLFPLQTGCFWCISSRSSSTHIPLVQRQIVCQHLHYTHYGLHVSFLFFFLPLAFFFAFFSISFFF